MGHTVFSMDSYRNPRSPIDPKRPPIDVPYDDHLLYLERQCTKDNLLPEFLTYFDTIIFMHRPDWILNNWEKIKNKHIIWRSIGQSTKDVESMLVVPKLAGTKLVRYSPEESGIVGYLGADAVIRFYKDKDEFSCWDGSVPAVMTVAQGMKTRGGDGTWCNYETFMRATEGFARVIFGPNNEDSGIGGGMLMYEDLKAAYRHHRVYFYTGTYPASYTLNFVEALMTGIPIVAIGEKLANLNIFGGQTYEVHKIIEHGVNGFCSNYIDELQRNIKYLMDNPDKAKEIGDRGRETAIKLFGKETVKKDWEKLFNS
jgi:glycosyltransferase involved in cell wall biosynthesis